jgi:spermidine synthase
VAGDLREILRHPVARVTYVELDPLLIEAARAHLSAQDARVLDDARVALVLTDGRQYVRQCARAGPGAAGCAFDVVILDLPEPSTAVLNRFYTREFFAEVRTILNPGGILALGLPSSENYWSPELARRNGSVYYTLSTVFPEVLVLPGEHNFFLASSAPLVAGPDLLARRLSERAVPTRWVTPAYIEYVMTTDRFTQVQVELAASAGVRINSDLAPVCYYYDLALWLSRFYPNLHHILERTSLINLWWLAIPLALAVTAIRWRRGLAVPFAIAAIGLAEMTLQMVILFGFQVLHGTVYADVSLIVTAFVGGLAAGGAAARWLLARWRAGRRTPGGDRIAVRARRTLAGILAIIVGYAALLPLILSLPSPAPRVSFHLLALTAGALTGMAFPLALALMRGSGGGAAGMLYGVDLLGGCLGAVLGAGFLVPVLGIPETSAVIALVGLAGLLALV